MAAFGEENLTIKAVSVEFLATLLLVFAGCGATIASVKDGESSATLQEAVAWGFVYMILTQMFANIGGVHMNPSITIALFATKKSTFRVTVMYIVTQGSPMFSNTYISSCWRHHRRCHLRFCERAKAVC